MTRLFRLMPILGLFALSLASCETPTSSTPPIGGPELVPWQRAVDLVNAGRVDEVFQTHALSVQLHLHDGSRVQTVEPAIDEIVRAIQRCGQTCAHIVIATE